ncbi:hypothetical protein KP509_23G014700 [Ceratopteris richardii]|uniref:Pectinesterase inhibitor domain-containing protein n=1 Tax=Ceratopteris richardii TaxID=49495 RepID=A0A8T2RX36_CERRI|nr:hypothetical protein KP509_23G014700 [Ceratopteris richardii]
MAAYSLCLRLLCFALLMGYAASAAPIRGHGLQHRRTVSPRPFVSACRKTSDPQLCFHVLMVSSAPPAAPLNRQIAAVSSFALHLTSSSYLLARQLARMPPPRRSPRTYRGALQDCSDLMSNSMDQLKLSISRLSALNTARGPPYMKRSQVMDAQVSLSASFTYQDICSDELRQRGMPTAATSRLLQQVGDTSRAVRVALDLADTLHQSITP